MKDISIFRWNNENLFLLIYWRNKKFRKRFPLSFGVQVKFFLKQCQITFTFWRLFLDIEFGRRFK